MSFSRSNALTALLLAMLAVGVATAPAQQASKPAPGCAGLATDDPAGDVRADGTDNYDVKGLFYTYDGSRLNVHVQIANMSLAVSKPGLGVRWIVIYRAGDAFYYVRALSDGSTMTYRYGTYDPTLDDFTGVADVKGSTVEGADGVITMEIPKAAGAKAGAKITESFVTVRETVEVTGAAPQTAYAPESDRAPDSGAAKEYQVVTCPGATGGAPAPVTPVVPVVAPTASGSGPAVLGVSAPASGGSARSASKRKSVVLKLKSSGAVSALKAELLKGNKVIGSGSLAKLNGAGSLKLKLKRKLAKGTYGLRLSGNVADGRTAQSLVKIKFGR